MATQKRLGKFKMIPDGNIIAESGRYGFVDDVLLDSAGTNGEGMDMIIDGDTITIGKNLIPDEPIKETKLNWFEKLLLFIKRIFKREKLLHQEKVN